MKSALIVALGGAIGSVFRFWVQRGAERLFDSAFPFGTFMVNIIGSFIIGVTYALAERSGLLTYEIRLFIMVGFCGGFTTFSSFAFDNLMMASGSQWQFLLINVFGSLVLGIAAVFAGIVVVRSLF